MCTQKIGLTEGRKNNGQKVKIKRQGARCNGKIQMIKSNGTKKVMGKTDKEQKAICNNQKEV